MKDNKIIPIILGILAIIYLGIIISNMPKEDLGYPSNCYIITPYYMSNGVPTGIPNAKLTIDNNIVYSDENGDALFCGMTSQSADRTVTIEPPSGYSPSKRTETLLGTWISGTTNFMFTRDTPTTTTTTNQITTTLTSHGSCIEIGLYDGQPSGSVCSAEFHPEISGGKYCYVQCNGITTTTMPYQQQGNQNFIINIVLIMAITAFIIFVLREHKVTF
jgi:hypothetical protein